ncbi:Splicing factor, suppressor of white-apricot-like protein [Armadillidium nasatum]|uniref:Splicing factor, suppressor of white-apricot-like protein n=1 Tax=Armadillidium nasatum TaxID=96803 RepID=A0A5N5SQT8_9CRUS|nr:Splicing factor, suppressor of white-apricot-like protein [Armadillidium nasatum]
MDYRHSMYDDPWGYQNKEELLIFGYSCKLFRDDEKALSLENGEHLIPWMGDSKLMIDRFDVRGTLYDLTEAESKPSNPEPLTEAEQKEEEICEQEQEESKRLQVELSSDGSYYNQVGFSYTNSQYEYNQVEEQDDQKQVTVAEPVTYSEPVSYNPSSDEDVFIPTPEMNIPPDMEVPKTVKQNKIIIKTAKFIVTQGAQMEIVIKTKQAGNVMFSFLAFDNPLNSYYKYVVSLIRNGRYRFEDETDSQTSPESNGQYLHPNLSQSVRPDLTPGAVASPSRPSPHCSYSKLITKIREKQKASVVIDDSETLSPVAPSSPVPVASSGNTDAKTNSVLKNGTSSDRVVSLVDYPSFNQTADGSDIEDIAPAFAKKSPKGTSHDYSKIKWPPREIQMVIDKMASYIIKNGSAFEEIVRSRSDSRFEFLNKTHEYHPYYKCKIELYSEVYGDIFKNSNKNPQDSKKKKENATSRKNVDQACKNGANRTISFSIKSRDQEVSLTSHTTFPIESSTSEEDEDMSDGEKERRKVDREQRRQARKLKEEKERKEREEFLKKERIRKEKEEEERKKEKERQAAEDESSGNEDLYDIFKYAQEMERDTKPKAKVKSKTKAKSKPESQEEPVLKQEERKKKAAAFLSKLKDTKEENKPVYGPQMPPEIEALLMQSASESPASSRDSSEREKPPLPLPASEPQKSPPPPPPKSPSPPGLTDMLLKSFDVEKPVSSREISLSPKRERSSGKESISLTCGLSSGKLISFTLNITKTLALKRSFFFKFQVNKLPLNKFNFFLASFIINF